MTKINFQSLHNRDPVEDVYDRLIKYVSIILLGDSFDQRLRGPHQGAELHDHYDLDLLGQDLVWANENFPADQFIWYHWFESVFVVPPEMYSYYVTKWS